MNLKRYASLVLLTIPLMAQTPSPFAISFNGMIANADLNKVVSSNNLAGYGLGLNVHRTVTPGLDLRFHGTLFGIKGKVGTGFDNVVRPSFSAGFDFYQEWNGNYVYAGILGTAWKQNALTATNYLFNNTTAVSTTAVNPDGGNNLVGNDIKWGFRVGIERPITSQWSVNFNFTQSEMNKVFNPSWFTVGVVYRFNQ